ncbi:MAG TPA: hypothetical protein VNE39_23470 [Planctomycetota bacterium]|nr:hypothetical protein [Planctomycetota bacterium]
MATKHLSMRLPAQDAAAVTFSYGHHAVGVLRRGPGAVRPVVAAAA